MLAPRLWGPFWCVFNIFPQLFAALRQFWSILCLRSDFESPFEVFFACPVNLCCSQAHSDEFFACSKTLKRFSLFLRIFDALGLILEHLNERSLWICEVFILFSDSQVHSGAFFFCLLDLCCFQAHFKACFAYCEAFRSSIQSIFCLFCAFLLFPGLNWSIFCYSQGFQLLSSAFRSVSHLSNASLPQILLALQR